jgi:hypothetical protein
MAAVPTTTNDVGKMSFARVSDHPLDNAASGLSWTTSADTMLCTGCCGINVQGLR